MPDGAASAAPTPVAGRSAFAAIRGLAGLTMISRVLGFVRDMLMAVALGTGLAADAFFLAWMIPNLFRRLFGDGAFAAALVPVFVEAREQGDLEGARRLVNSTVTRLAVFLTGVIVVGELVILAAGSEAGRGFLANHLSPLGLSKLGEVLDLARILLPYLVFICLAGLLGGALNALDRFAVPAAAPIVFNAVWIVALLVGASVVEDTPSRVRFLAGALIVGGVIQLAMHVVAMRSAGCPVVPTWRADPERSRRVRNLFLSLAVGLALFQLNALLDSLIAYTLCPEGGVSALYYANRLVQLPIGVLGVALSTAIFPALARLVKQGDMTGLGETLDRGVVLGAFVAIPATFGLAVLAEPVITTLFQRGRFDAESSARTSRALLFLSPAVIMACVTPVITRAFYAEEEVKTPVRVGVVCVLLNLGLNLALVGPMQEAGLALATTLSQTANLVIQVVLYRRRRLSRGDPPRTLATVKQVAVFTALAAVMAGAAWGTHHLVPAHGIVRLVLAIGVGVVIYAGVAWKLKLEPVRLLLSRR